MLRIILTIVVLALKVPHGDIFAAPRALLPTFVSHAAAILLSFLNPWAGFSLYWLVALIWLGPDRRIE